IIVPTPIGNLEDITLRALKALRECDFIICEDTRRTLKLLIKYSISKKLIRYNEHNEKSVNHTLEMLKAGKKIAMVSDGGSPCISDPGRKIVKLAKENGIKVDSLPGPSAVITAAAGSGMPVDSFVFLGFLPRSKSKISKMIGKALELEKTVILYESPYRIKSFMEIVINTISPDIEVSLARELTKVYEEWLEGSAAEVLKNLQERKQIKGEFVVLLRKPKQQKTE
ncbi:MAG: 16S rRNA (cytidine(1402)-2'-O)-methyltransferase, partial [Elusimicrobiales bacterium]|nr:16S rRNA (cytidine(1402)-2'-O)-methyltransferase [Elusimicrobiales bacterium]